MIYSGYGSSYVFRVPDPTNPYYLSIFGNYSKKSKFFSKFIQKEESTNYLPFSRSYYQCCGSGSAWIQIQQKVKEQINKTVNSGLFVLLDSSIE